MEPNQYIRAALALLSALVLGACSPAEPPSRDSDEVAIRALIQRNFESASRQDVDGVMATHWPDSDVQLPGQPRISGSEGTRQVESDWQTQPGYRGYEGRVESVRFISFDAAIAEMVGRTLLDDGEIAEQTTIVVSRHDGEWRISAWRVMVLDEPVQAFPLRARTHELASHRGGG